MTLERNNWKKKKMKKLRKRKVCGDFVMILSLKCCVLATVITKQVSYLLFYLGFFRKSKRGRLVHLILVFMNEKQNHDLWGEMASRCDGLRQQRPWISIVKCYAQIRCVHPELKANLRTYGKSTHHQKIIFQPDILTFQKDDGKRKLHAKRKRKLVWEQKKTWCIEKKRWRDKWQKN
jgi:hypothetical protein